jgi:hypothetical protein
MFLLWGFVGFQRERGRRGGKILKRKVLKEFSKLGIFNYFEREYKKIIPTQAKFESSSIG